MKTLPIEFDKAFDGLGTHHFKQVRRQRNVVIYERKKKDGTLFAYEVFRVKSHTFPALDGGRTEESEAYPRADAFGKTAYFCMSMERAESRFAQLLDRKETI